ncbi:MAG: hypothetical protein IPJ62_13940, partial [Betaproteobacteria bacterium]|nr:hypothetical protein [Betaproteobacteria bacterium]
MPRRAPAVRRLNGALVQAGIPTPPPKSGERRLQILQTLAAMLENPRGEKVTTAALAARL